MASVKKADEEIAAATTRPESFDIGTVEKTDDAVRQQFYGNSITGSYRLKSELVNRCMDEIGMGTYQWLLFVVAGCGGMVDNFWSQGISTVQPPVAIEFTDVTRVTFSSIAYNAGLICGASFWGISADFIGRKPAFNSTLLIGGIFGIAVGGVDSFVGFCVLWAIIGTAAGGNVPVDNMFFLEYLPSSHQWLLTALSTWWIVGQLIVSLIGWAFIANFSCPTNTLPGTCTKGENMGWRYTMYVLGGLALAFSFIRIFLFKMPESPRYLLSKNRDADAVEAVNYVARRNGKPELLTLAMLQQVDHALGISPEETGRRGLTKMQILQESLGDFKTTNFKCLFVTPRLAQHTTIIWLIWLIIGIAYPLYFNFLPTYLARKFTMDTSLSTTYRNYCIQSAVGTVGPFVAALLIQTRLGRRYVMAISAVITGIFLFAYTAAKTPDANLAFSAITGMVGNLEYAILFAFTPESFPAPHRGLSTGFASALLRFGGLTASLIATYTNFTTAPIYVAAAMWIGAGLLTCLLPFETHDHAAI
ncbi:putative MFS-type transporter PB1E7.08c [Lasiodiplodia hormozganensis]|uniref:MFS-type transporter PB1E7.08c n=1 Tax=Lasiodiplodia hormozganensis TaxID=869390 RepID=A0AA39Y347_9PEZI|nr:putative MFS-type transporter PB1E7.08c [Lasiodiplodia hormozganensis]